MNDDNNLALFCDFENIALGVRDANYAKFDIRPVLEKLLLKDTRRNGKLELLKEQLLLVLHSTIGD